MSVEERSKEILKFTERLSFPRLCGTQGERKAQDLIRTELKSIGIKVEEPPVKWSTAPWNLALPLLCLLGIVTGIFTLYFMRLDPSLVFIGLLTMVADLVIFGGALITGKAYWWKSDKNPPSLNFIGKIPATRGEPKTIVVFSSHYDSKSQSVPALWRVIFILFAGLGLLGFLVFAILSQIGGLLGTEGTGLVNAAFIGGVIFFFFLVLGASGTASVRLGNRSPGALDNATGVAVCVELARYFHLHPLEDVEIQIGIFTGEELGLYGARAYVRENGQTLKEKNAMCLNYDGVKSPLRYLSRLGSMKMEKPKYRPFFDHLMGAVEESGIKLEKVTIPFGVWTDSVPFVNEGIPSTTVISLIGANYVHTSRDNVDKLDEKALVDATKLGIAFGEHLQKNL